MGINRLLIYMARKRIVDPEFWKDTEISNQSERTRLLYLGSWNFADDNGIFENNIKKIRAEIFPYKSLDIEKNYNQLIKLEKFIPYEVDGKKYIWIKNFPKWQKGIKFPSYRYPLPSPELLDKYGYTTIGLAIVEKSKVKKSKEEKSNILPELRNWKPPLKE